ncbi:hypothetical protein MATL_G00031100 [Megalops atlanticus]|uniref:TSC22 domain family protein 2 n=1 Tax=Megalops atlanticus TaxID=7932 RepID=A0A9D3TK00_MEGAT|nr:hypothetical protein MATL_G00031100 [Megalops atlanticus]
MSKMPAKKKSCFQITSVTQAQVAASSITDDTESLDDPDESRTEDVSSEIFDVSRADFEPEVCDISSSEETLNNVGESEALSAVALHIPQDGQLPAASGPPNGGFAFRSTAVSGVAHVSPHVLGAGGAGGQPPTATAGLVQQSAPVSAGGASNVSAGTSQPPPAVSVASSTTTASCSSRFRVIKLDHGTGEPFRRGRWTCTEYYERDSEGAVNTRTADSIKPASTLDQNLERDSGLGVTGGSVVAPAAISAPGPDSAVDSSCMAVPHLHPVDPQQQQQQQSYGIGHQPVSGAFQPPVYSAVPSSKPVAVPMQPQVQVSMQPAAPQNLLPPGHNGMQASVTMQQVQKSPSMPPVTQAQQFAYPAQHLPTVVPASQADYRQQQLLMAAQPAGAPAQTLPVASLPVGPSVSQGPSPVMTPAAGGAQVLGLLGQSGESAGPAGGSLTSGQPPPAQGLLPQPGAGTGGTSVAPLPGASVPQQLPVGQHQPSGLAGSAPVAIAPHVVVPSVQNVPTAVPGTSSTPLTMPNPAPSAVGQPLPGQPQAARSGSVPGLGFGQPPVAQVDENRRKSDALPQPSVISGKDATKPLIPESLQLPTPSVNSLFGISINLDGDEDRNPSTAFYQAFPSSKLRDSKSHSDSASGASVVAIDNKIEQAMDLVKSHLMYAVREEVEVLKEQIKELYERNSVLERENAVLKSLANNEQLSQLSVQLANPSGNSPQQPPVNAAPQECSQPLPLPQQPNVSSA